MTRKTTDHTAPPPVQRDPDEWKSDEPMTDAQRSYLETLSRDIGEPFDDTLSKAEASKRIDELRGRSPRLDHASRDVDPDSAASQVDRDDTGYNV